MRVLQAAAAQPVSTSRSNKASSVHVHVLQANVACRLTAATLQACFQPVEFH
jgi:hypothetical protein